MLRTVWPDVVVPLSLLSLPPAAGAASNGPFGLPLVPLRYFFGLTVSEAAAALGVAPRTADASWA